MARESYRMKSIDENASNNDAHEAHTRYEVDEEPIYGAHHVILLFVPVTLCMAFVVITISSVNYFSRDDGQYLVYTPFHPEETDTGGDTLLKSLLNSLIILAVVVTMTFLLILLYKIRCYKLIHGWIIMSSLMLLFLFSFIYIQEFLKAFNISADLPSTLFFLLNFGVTGMFVIHWKGPLLIQQAYLIISASLMSLVFIKYLPEWTLWLVLGILAIWDLIAVLAPHGPLKMLVETASERGESIMPALIYSSTVMYPVAMMADAPDNKEEVEATDKTVEPGAEGAQAESAVDSKEEDAEEKDVKAEAPPAPPTGAPKVKDEETGKPHVHLVNSANLRDARRRSSDAEDKGVKLGLGDFIFYSVLVGKASAGQDHLTTIACFIAILMGLFLTLAILVTVKKALPALPISIFFGLLFHFSTYYAISPMVTDLAAKQLFY